MPSPGIKVIVAENPDLGKVSEWYDLWGMKLNAGKTNARATLDKKSCVITSTLFEMNSTCMCWCDLNF